MSPDDPTTPPRPPDATVDFPAGPPPTDAPEEFPDDAIVDGPPPAIARAVRPALGRLGRFQLREVLGQGGAGTVYRASDPALGRDVALRVIEVRPDQRDLAARLLEAARAAATLKHPHIVAVLDCGTEGDRLFVATELVDGASLAARLARGERRSPRQAAEWARDLAMALHYAHTRHTLHRDVCPANVLIDHHGRAFLADFDTSSSPGAAAKGLRPAYVSPEVARGEADRIGPAADVYSLGMVLYELLTRKPPFAGPPRQVLVDVATGSAPPAPREIDPRLPLGLEAVVLKATQRSQWDRYLSAADLAVDLQRWLKGDPVSAPLRVVGELVKVCPECRRWNRGAQRQRCMYCDTDLARVEPEDTRFLGEQDPAPIDDDDEDDRPRRRRPRGR